jgi:carboxyl-terminal processing protease
VVQNQPEQPVRVRSKKQVSLSTLVMACAVMAIGFFILGTRAYLLPSPFSKSTSPSQLDFSSLNDVYSVLRSKYDGTIDTAKLIDGAKHGMVDALGDPYTVYFNAEEAKAFNSDLNGTFEGIGAELGKNGSQLSILGVLADSPAEKAGLQKNDIILKVNGEDTSTMTVGSAVTKIRGEKGTSIKLTILRGETTKEYSITRDTITSPSVTSEILEGNVGYMRIARFGDDTSGLARKAAENFKAQGVSKVILDLRGNGGGLLTAAQSVSSLWLKDKVIVSERSGGVVTDTLRSQGEAILEGIKTVVLVDGNSASASEIVAGALKDNKAATLVGEKTFGKGSVQVIDDITSGGSLKVTIARWYTPNGVNINKEGIQPDKEVKISDEDVKAAKDTQKITALSLLNQ